MKFPTDPEEIKKIIVDPSSNDVYLILPIFPLGKAAKPPDDFAIDDDFSNTYNRLQRAIGKADLTLMKTLDNKFAHPRRDGINPETGQPFTAKDNYIMQSHYSIGKLGYVFPKPDSFNRVIGAYQITDPKGKEVVMRYEDYFKQGVVPFFTSSQIVRDGTEHKYKVRNFDLMHTTLTDEPAFGKELSRVSAVCQGDVKSCVMNYAAASNTVAEIGLNIMGDVVEINHTKDSCPFCVETELVNIFENNIKNSEYILNSASINQMEQQGKQDVIKPDEDQSSNNASRAPIDVEKLTAEVTKRIEDQRKQAEVNPPAEEEKKEDNPPAEPPKEGKLDIENSPVVKALLAKISKLEENQNKINESLSTKDKTIQELKSKTNETEIGDLLALHESNFINPETGKVEPDRWEEAFKWAKENNLSKSQLETILKKVTPFGSLTKKAEVAAMVTNKASTNRGVPKYNAAFGSEDSESDEKEKETINSASMNNQSQTPAGIRFMSRVVASNNLE